MPGPSRGEKTMKNATRAAAAVLAAALCIGATACGSADQTASQTETPAASSQTPDASSQTPDASSQTPTASDTASATDAASTAASAAADYTQDELQATVDQLEAMPKAVMPGYYGDKGNGLTDRDPSRDARLMQEYDALVADMKPQNNTDDGEFALDGTWIMTSYDASYYGEELTDSKPEDLPHFFYGPLLKRIGAPEGTGTTFTDGQWAHAEWTGYRAIWKTDGNRYTLYIIMV